MKWRQIEWNQGQRNFAEADRALKLLSDKNIPLRGHAMVWGVDEYVPKWLKYLPANEQKSIVKAHIQDIGKRYKGKLTHWDVNNGTD